MEVVRISSFDGQSIWLDHNSELFEVGNFLGGGAAGNVYECEHVKTHERFALKVLNPLGYKILTPALLKRCNVILKGKSFMDADKSEQLKKDHVWWVVNGTTKQYLACYFSEKLQSLKELSLNQCIDVFGMEGNLPDDTENLNALRGVVPVYPPKYLDFLRKRNKIFREIRNMRKISNHRNVIRLDAVLELIQDSKSTIFLVMELANGGELFDRIKIDCGTREETAKIFFRQLLEGVKHCHDQGVCHRDLKPENLLLQDDGVNGTILKIADFGFSAYLDQVDEANAAGDDRRSLPPPSPSNGFQSPLAPREEPLRVLKSIVGSPFYVAPEVMQSGGYDGTKVDVWSLGVILYAMLAGNLPFGQDLTTCKRFRHFCKWVKEQTAAGVKFWDDPNVEYPPWLFTPKFSPSAKGLIVAMLHPDPAQRITVEQAMRHPLCGFNFPPANTPSTPVSVAPPNTPFVNNFMSPSQPVQNVNLNLITPAPAQIHIAQQIDQSNTRMEMENQTEVKDSQHSSNVSNNYEDEIAMFKMEEEEDTAEEKEAMDYHSSDSPVIDDHKQPSAMVVEDNSSQMNPSNAFTMSSSYGSIKTLPVVPQSYLNAHPVRELIVRSPEEAEDEVEIQSPVHHSHNTTSHGNGIFRQDSGSSENRSMPSFNDRVKRSTRFITSVPADEVLSKIEGILKEVRTNRIETPAGFITRVDVDWEYYRLEVFGLDSHQPICALQLYQLPSANPSGTASPDGYVNSPSQSYGSWMHSTLLNQQQPQLMVEFIRGQIEIFAFKRFYQWVRIRLSELVKKDYAMSFFEQAASPVFDRMIYNRYQQIS